MKALASTKMHADHWWCMRFSCPSSDSRQVQCKTWACLCLASTFADLSSILIMKPPLERFLFWTCWIVVQRATTTLWHCFSLDIHEQLQQVPGPPAAHPGWSQAGHAPKMFNFASDDDPGLVRSCSIIDEIQMLIMLRYTYIYIYVYKTGMRNAVYIYIPILGKKRRKLNGVVQAGRWQEWLC